VHELILGGAAFGGYAAAVASRIAWLRRKRTLPLGVGDRAPSFGPLPLASGGEIASRDLRSAKAVVLVFMSNACPGVKAYDARLRDLHASYHEKGVAFLALNPIDEEIYPGEDLASMASAAKLRSLPYAYAKDTAQQVAMAYGAVCTPHVFVLDHDGKICYRGRIDDALLEQRAKKRYLRDAIDAVLAGRTPEVTETAPLGCAIEFSRQRGRASWLRFRVPAGS
jgi:peroxiredoxin